MDTLDPHILLKIMTHVPLGEMIRIRAVCRRWRMLTSVNLRNSSKSLEIRVDSQSGRHFRFVKPWRTKFAPIDKFAEIFDLCHLAIYEPLAVTTLKVRAENSLVIEHVPFFVLKNICMIGDHCPNINRLILSEYILFYAEELDKIRRSFPNLTNFTANEIRERYSFDNVSAPDWSKLRHVTSYSANGELAEFVSANSSVTSLTMPLSWHQVDDTFLRLSRDSFRRLTKLALTSAGDLKSHAFARTFFENFANLEYLKIENTREHMYNGQALTMLAECMRYMPRLKQLAVDDYRSQRPITIIVGNGTQQPVYDLMLACRNLTNLYLKVDVSKPSIICQAVSVAAEQSQLETLELDFRCPTPFVEYSPLFHCAKTDQFASLKRLTLHNVAKSNILVLVVKKCPTLETLRLHKDALTEDDLATFCMVQLGKPKHQQVNGRDEGAGRWRTFRLELQKTSRWYNGFIRRLVMAKVRNEMYTSETGGHPRNFTARKNFTAADHFAMNSVNANYVGLSATGGNGNLVPAYKLWNNETGCVVKIYDLIRFSAYTDTKNYLFGNFNY